MKDEQPQFVQDTIGAMQDLTTILWSAAALLAPWLVPLAPAAFFGLALWETASKTDMPPGLAVAVGVAGAVGLETVNIAAAHAAIQLSHKRQEHGGKFALSILLVVFYVIAGVGSMLMLDVPLNTRVIGVAMFLLAPVAITAQALTMDLKRVRERDESEQAKEAEERDYQRQREEDHYQLTMQQSHELKMERVRLNAEVRIAQAQASTEPAPEPAQPAQPAPEQIECGHCERSFASVQALNAHQRFCKAGTNGKEPAPEPEQATPR